MNSIHYKFRYWRKMEPSLRCMKYWVKLVYSSGNIISNHSPSKTCFYSKKILDIDTVHFSNSCDISMCDILVDYHIDCGKLIIYCDKIYLLHSNFKHIVHKSNLFNRHLIRRRRSVYTMYKQKNSLKFSFHNINMHSTIQLCFRVRKMKFMCWYSIFNNLLRSLITIICIYSKKILVDSSNNLQ